MIVNGVYKPTYNWGAPHCMVKFCQIAQTPGPNSWIFSVPIFVSVHPPKNHKKRPENGVLEMILLCTAKLLGSIFNQTIGHIVVASQCCCFSKHRLHLIIFQHEISKTQKKKTESNRPGPADPRPCFCCIAWRIFTSRWPQRGSWGQVV